MRRGWYKKKQQSDEFCFVVCIQYTISYRSTSSFRMRARKLKKVKFFCSKDIYQFSPKRFFSQRKVSKYRRSLWLCKVFIIKNQSNVVQAQRHFALLGAKQRWKSIFVDWYNWIRSSLGFLKKRLIYNTTNLEEYIFVLQRMQSYIDLIYSSKFHMLCIFLEEEEKN